MSSHHIVRDEQEPGLYIYSANNFLLEALGDLLEWSPTVVASPAALKKVIDFGIKVDAVTGVPAVDVEELVQSQGSIRTWPVAADDASALLQLLEGEGYGALNIAVLDEDVTDMLLFLKSYRGALNCSVHSLTKRITRINSRTFSKWLNAGSYEMWDCETEAMTINGAELEEAEQPDSARFQLENSGLVELSSEKLPYWFVEPFGR